MMEAPSFALDDGDDVRLAPSFSMIYFFVLSILLFIFLFFPLPHPLLYPQDFDWDAAVREIDSACRVASTSTSDRQGFAAPPAASSSAPESRPKPAKINGKARQLTLERFVDSFTKRKKIGDGPFGSRIWERDAPVDQGKEGNPGAGDEPPAVRIDLEAAKTWIYPGKDSELFLILSSSHYYIEMLTIRKMQTCFYSFRSVILFIFKFFPAEATGLKKKKVHVKLFTGISKTRLPQKIRKREEKYARLDW